MTTVEAFRKSYGDTPHFDLIKGKVFRKPPEGNGYRGRVQAALVQQLNGAITAKDLGVVCSDFAFRLSAETLYRPAVAVVVRARQAQVDAAARFASIAPDLAIDIIAPNETATHLLTRIKTFRAAGTPILWAIYPDLREVVVYHPDGTSRTVAEDGSLDGGNILPGLKIVVASLFAAVKA